MDVSARTPQSAAPLAPRRAQAVGASLSGSGPHAPQASWYSLKAESGTQSLGRPQNHPAQSQGWDKIPNPQRNRIIKDPASRKPSWLCPGPMGCWDCGVRGTATPPSPRPICPWSCPSCRHWSLGDPLEACGGGGRGRHRAARLPGQEQSSHSTLALVPGPRGLLTPPKDQTAWGQWGTAGHSSSAPPGKGPGLRAGRATCELGTPRTGDCSL